MQKVAFTMQLKPGYENEYKKRHDQIWPELSQALKNAGIRDYAIFLDKTTRVLFAVQDLEEDADTTVLPGQEIVMKWWEYMADIMETNPDHSPRTTPLQLVFELDSME